MTGNLTSNSKSLQMMRLLKNNKMCREDVLYILDMGPTSFYKHMDLLNRTGFIVERKDNVYEIKKFENQLEFTNFETSMLAYLMSMSNALFPRHKTNDFERAMRKMLYLSTQESSIDAQDKYNFFKMVNEIDCYQDKVRVFENFIEKKAELKITVCSGKEFVLTPVGFDWNKDKVHINFFNENKEAKSIALETIVKVVPNGREEYTLETRETIFELYGRLAKSYLLKEDERIVDSRNGVIIVANRNSDKKQLFRRLLRYDVLCKVLFPKSDADEFNLLIEQSIKNLESM